VAIEVVEAVVDALAGKLSPNAVNAPMVRRLTECTARLARPDSGAVIRS
jgi:hypothetical protein